MTYFVLATAVLAAIALFDLLQRERTKVRKAREHAARLADENRKHLLALAAVLDVLEDSAGGLEARIDEHCKLTEAIQKNAPGLVRIAPEVPTWLNRHDCFWKALRAAAAHGQ